MLFNTKNNNIFLKLVKINIIGGVTNGYTITQFVILSCKT